MSTMVRVDETALRMEMLKNGMRLITELETASGVPRATLDNMVAGRNTPNQRTIQAVFDALPASKVEDLFPIFFTHGVTYDVTVTEGGGCSGVGSEI